MSYRTGTYVAFDGLGKVDPTQSDFKYYATIQAWCANKNIDFKITNSHEKTYAVKDLSSRETLYSRIRQRLKVSKQMLVILTKDTRYIGSVLSYEIEQAVDNYKLPLIIAYPGYDYVLNVAAYRNLWPKALIDRIDGYTIQAIHIPFKLVCLLDAISRFSVNGESLQGGKTHYTEDAYKSWGLI